MSIKLIDEVKELISQPNTKKAIATISKDGIPHITYKGSLAVTEDDKLEFLEILESSITNKNMVNSIWFDKKVAINILGENKKSYLIIGTVERGIICGKEFQKRYEEVLEKSSDLDLATIWIISPEEIRDESFDIRLDASKKEHPLQLHLDKIAKNN